MSKEHYYIALFEIGKSIQLQAGPDLPLLIYTSAGYISISLERERQWVYEMYMDPQAFRQRIIDECGSQYDPDEVASLFSKMHQISYPFDIKEYIPWKGYSIEAKRDIYEGLSKPIRFIYFSETENGMPYNMTNQIARNWGAFYYQTLPMAIEQSLHDHKDPDTSPEHIAQLRKLFLNQNGFPDSPEWFERICGPLHKLKFNQNYALNNKERKAIGQMRPSDNLGVFRVHRFWLYVGISAALIFAPILLVFGALCLPYLITRMGA